MGEAHRVGLDETDAAGVAFAPALIALAHRAYERAAAGRGIDLAALIRAREIALPLVRVEADFSRPIRHGDELDLACACVRIGESSYAVRIAFVAADGRPSASVTQVHACVDLAAGRARPLPDWLRAALEAWR